MKHFIFASTITLGCLVGCGQKPAPKEPEAVSVHPSCAAIHAACDPHEQEGGEPKGCHDLGSNPASTEDACAARKNACLAACPPAP